MPPEKCDSGLYAVVPVCSHKMLKQEAPYEIPMPDPFLCYGYVLKAAQIVTI